MEENGVRCCGKISCSLNHHFNSALGIAFGRWLVGGQDGEWKASGAVEMGLLR